MQEASSNSADGTGSMGGLLHQIHVDHGAMVRLLDILDTQLGVFYRGQTPDYELMLDIMRYMLNYPDIAHHPAEELIFERLLVYAPALSPQVMRLYREHAGLHEAGQQFEQLLQTIVGGNAILPREQLEQAGRDYVDVLREHIWLEEAEVLHTAERVFRPRDWREIEQSFPKIVDPLTSETLLRQYRSLYRHLNWIQSRSAQTVAKKPD